MLFNSYDFLFGFLPLVLLAHHLLVRRVSRNALMAFLVVASLAFYAWWYPPYLLLLGGSILGNFFLGRRVSAPDRDETVRYRWLTLGVSLNLGLLAWFKYAGFLDRNVEAAFGIDLGLPSVVLPLAISFFTFQQIAYLVDTYRGLTKDHGFVEYALFVSFFPQLIAGPIVHHGEVLPQFQQMPTPRAVDRAVGLTMLVLGLAKKVLLADTIGIYADQYFGVVEAGGTPTFLGAWAAAIAFYFEVYFDFAGYSDMAVGLARFFGIKLPVNFDAPYRATSAVDLWQRWHVTLSRFLRDYLYIPLGGNRRGQARRYINLMATMVLGGLWHGAAWTFVVWGALHGAFLLINHAWWWVRGGPSKSRGMRLVGLVLTNLGFMEAAVFFRARELGDAVAIVGGQVGLGVSDMGDLPSALPWMFLGLLAINQLAPTSQRWLEHWEPVIKQGVDRLRWPERFTWQPTPGWGIVIALLGLACLPFIERAGAFIYFQF